MSKSLVPLAIDYESTFGALNKSSRNSIESYRLWYEYLLRGFSRLDLTINLDYYKVWDIRKDEGFFSWWERAGQNVTIHKNKIPALIIESENAHQVAPTTHIKIAIPNNLTATEAGELVRKLLLNNNHSRKLTIDYPEIRKDAEIRHLSLRSYLVCYDCYQGMLHNRQSVSYIELLSFVRRAYFLQRKFHKPLKDPLPSTLCGDGPDPKGYENINNKDDKQAIATLKRYVLRADQIIRNVAEGRFPD